MCGACERKDDLTGTSPGLHSGACAGVGGGPGGAGCWSRYLPHSGGNRVPVAASLCHTIVI